MKTGADVERLHPALKIGESCRIDPTSTIVGEPGTIKLAARVSVHRSSTLDSSGGHIEIGSGTVIFPYAMLIAHSGGSISLGANCTVNPFAVLYGHGGLKIGNYVRIATHTVIIPANHKFSDPNTPITKQGLTREGVTIEDDVWIGANVTILDGVIIGRGSVVAAGAVVNNSVLPMSIIGGVPARIIGSRGRPNEPK